MTKIILGTNLYTIFFVLPWQKKQTSTAKTKLGPLSIKSTKEIYQMNWIISVTGVTERE